MQQLMQQEMGQNMAGKEKSRNEWKRQICETAGVDSAKGGVTITKAGVEVFTVLWIYEEDEKVAGDII